MLLQRLDTTFGISATVLRWFPSYLVGREQSVLVDNVLVSSSPLQFGVPQGSMLGPLLLTLYSQPLSDLICRGVTEYVTACTCHSDVCVRVCQNEIKFG